MLNYPVWIAQCLTVGALGCCVYVAADAVLRLPVLARRVAGRLRFRLGRPVRIVREGWSS